MSSTTSSTGRRALTLPINAAKRPPKALLAIAKQAGFTEQSFEACLTDQKLSQAIEESARRANEKFGVSGTPTFFINGQMLRGEATLEAMSKVIDPMIKAE